jgi:response regulator NasT
MPADTDPSLRVLVADEDREELDHLVELLRGLGHEVVGRAVHPHEAKDAVREERPEVALVRVFDDDEHALALVAELVDAVTCPVVAILGTPDPAFVRRAARLGLLAFAAPGPPAALQSAIELALLRFGDLERLSRERDELQATLERRVLIERAKGVLMERHGLGEDAAYRLLRDHARDHRQPLAAVAAQVLELRGLLPARRPGEP